ncbi:MAG: dihydrolipoyl dehydrogenase [Salinispira sp.]
MKLHTSSQNVSEPSSQTFDLIIIGSGPGGYVAAERAAGAGQRVLLIEKEKIGGVCLNWGCIPTKSLLNASKTYHHALNSRNFGIIADNVRFDLAAAMKWKEKTITHLQQGITSLMKKHTVQVLYGEAILRNAHTVQVNNTSFQARNVIIASGSSAVIPPIQGVDQDHVLTNRGVITIDTLPKRVAIIGGGIIGLEFASFFSGLGKDVEIFEVLDEIAPVMDREMAGLLRKAMPQVRFHLQTRVENIEGGRLWYSHLNEKSEKSEKSEQNTGKTTGQSIDNVDMVILATGRRANIQNIGLEAARIDTDKNGIIVNEQMQTNVPGVYAIGDVTGRSLLAHAASRMAEVAVNSILGHKDRMRYGAIPWAVYTMPEAAGCGLSEQEALKQGRKIRIARYDYRANGRALAEGSEGQAKIIVDECSEKILGIHLMGSYATENIFAASIIIENELRVRELKDIVFPHPTVSEALREALFRL